MLECVYFNVSCNFIVFRKLWEELNNGNVIVLTLSNHQLQTRPHVAKRSMQSCSSSYTNYCLNQGQCMYLVDVNQHHCKCEMGYYGPRCANQEFLVQPMGEETILVIIFGVGLLVIGLSGLLYFCCKWHKKRRFLAQQKGQGYKGVRTT
uniref:Proepiregulin-like n=1 Tax=Salarias fasciatus TaxID=181472 RepID=A0A672H5H6_SALFA